MPLSRAPTARPGIGAPLTAYPDFVRSPPKIVIAGDSRGANHTSGLQNSARGPLCWARWKLNGRFDMDAAAWNTSVAGTQIAVDNSNGISLLHQLPAALALKPGFLFLISDVNDTFANRTGEQKIADMTTVLSTVLAAGVTPIVMTEVTASTFTATQRSYADRYNAWVRALRQDARILVVDAALRARDWTNASGTNLGGAGAANSYLYDGLHFGPLSAELVGDDLAAALDPRLPPGLWDGMLSPTDAYDATLNVAGSLLGAAGRLTGTTGTPNDVAFNAGSTVTGTVAAGCSLYKTYNGPALTVAATAGATAALAFGADAVTLPVQTFTAVANSGTGLQTVTFQLPDITTGFAAGDVVQASAFTNIRAATGLYGCSLQLWDVASGGTVNQSVGDLSNGAIGGVNLYQQARAKAGFQRTGRMTLTAATAKLRPLVITVCDVALANLAIDVAAATVVKRATSTGLVI